MTVTLMISGKHAQHMSNAEMAVCLQEQKWWSLNLMLESSSGTVFPRMCQLQCDVIYCHWNILALFAQHLTVLLWHAKHTQLCTAEVKYTQSRQMSASVIF